MRRGLELALAFAQILISVPAFAISRVGTCGLTDPVEQFSVARVPAPYVQVNPLVESDGVAVKTVTPVLGLPGLKFANGTALVYPMREDYPELLTLDRAQWKRKLVDENHWTSLTTVNPCIEVATIVNGGLRVTLASWGGGKGVEIRNETAGADTFAQELIDSLVLQPGACAW